MGMDNKEIFDKAIDLLGNQKTTKQKQGIAKVSSIAMLVGIFIVGVVGSFNFAGFNMTAFVQFLDVAMWPLMLFILSVGAGSIVGSKKKEVKKDDDKKETPKKETK